LTTSNNKQNAYLSLGQRLDIAGGGCPISSGNKQFNRSGRNSRLSFSNLTDIDNPVSRSDIARHHDHSSTDK
jgi:hypothetical protein